MPIQTVELDFPFGAEIPAIFCPACGEALQLPEQEVEQPACPHVAFCYLDIIQDFIYVSEPLRSLIEEAEEGPEGERYDHLHYETVEALMGKQEGGRTSFVLSVQTSGMACGPTSSTVVFGISFLPE